MNKTYIEIGQVLLPLAFICVYWAIKTGKEEIKFFSWVFWKKIVIIQLSWSLFGLWVIYKLFKNGMLNN